MLKILYLPFLLLLSLTAFLLGTESGLQTSLTLLQHTSLLPAYTFHAVHGRLAGDFSIEQLQWNTPTARYKVQKLSARWHPLLLLKAQLLIHNVTLDHLRIAAQTNSSPLHSGGGSLIPKLLKNSSDLDIPQLSLSGHFTYHTVDTTLRIALPPPFGATTLRLHGPYTGYHIEWNTRNNSATWQLKGMGTKKGLALQTPTASTSAYRLHTQLTWKPILQGTLSLTGPKTTIQLSLNQQWKALWKLSLPKIQAFFPGNITGNVLFQGSLSGPRQTPHFSASITGTQIHTPLYHIPKATLHIEGEPKQHRITCDVRIGTKTLHAQWEGGWQASQWEGQWTQCAFQHSAKHGLWRLKNAAALQLSAQKIALQDFKLIQNKGKGALHLNLNWKPHHPKGYAVLSLVHFPLQTIYDFFPLKQNWIEDIHGMLEGVIRIDRNDQKTISSGNIALYNGYFHIPSLQLKPRFSLHITGTNKTLSYQVQLYTQKHSPLTLRGTTELQADGIPSHITLQARHFLISNTPNIQIYLTPDLTIETQHKTIDLRGNLHIPAAKIIPYDFKQSQTLSPDVVFVDDMSKKTITPHPNAPQPFLTTAHIALTLGKSVNIDVKGLKGCLEGHLLLNKQMDHPVLATGQLQLHNGSYSLYGEQLEVTHGYFHFINSTLDNPSINIQATRSFSSSAAYNSFLKNESRLKVGINITGHLKKPTTHLFSDPPGKSFADILSILIFGTTSNQLSGNDPNLLLKALTLLSSGNSHSGVGSLIQHLRHTLGLNEFTLESQSLIDEESSNLISQNTALVLGKYLSPRLYVKYSHGLLDPVNILSIRYALSKHLTLRTQTSNEGNGVDLLYTIEHPS